MSPTSQSCSCAACGTPSTPGAQFCSQCGVVLTTRTPESKWYHNLWFVLFMLFFVLGPFGLPLVWKNPRFSRSVKLALTAAMVLYAVILVKMTIDLYRMTMKQIDQLGLGF